MLAFLQDIRFNFRQCRRNPGSMFLTAMTLALGVGANTAIFLLTYTVVFASLPVPRPGELVRYTFTKGASETGLSTAQYEALRARQRVTSGLFAWSNQHAMVQENGRQEQVTVGLATGSVFSVLELRPYLGNKFDPEAGERSQPFVPEVLLSYDYWKTHFGGDRGVLGRLISINKARATIIGVLPPEFNGISPENKVDLLLPLSFESVLQPMMDQNRAFWLNVMGRLRPEYQIPVARAALASVQREITEEADPQHVLQDTGMVSGYDLGVESGRTGTSFLRMKYQKPLVALEGLCILMMLLCTTNVALLVLSRMSSRLSEFALRSALGAQPGRLFRQIVTEMALLGTAGLLLGAFLGWILAHTLVAIMTPAGQPALLDIRPGAVVYAFAAILSIGAATLAAIWPAWRASRVSPAMDLKQKGSIHATRKLGDWIVPVQVALGVLFLSTAMLLSSTFRTYLRESSGFAFDQVSFAEVTVDPGENQQNRKLLDIVERLKTFHGIQATAMSMPPIHGWIAAASFHTEDSAGNVHDNEHVWPQFVTRDYFKTLGTKIIAGRPFAPSDIAGERVCLLSAATATYFFPEGNAIGNWLKDGGSQDAVDPKDPAGCRVIGITENARLQSLLQPPPLQVYEMIEKQKQSLARCFFAVRWENTEPAANQLRRVLEQSQPGAASPRIYTFSQLVNQDLSRQRLLGSVSSGFAVLSLALLATGLYGILIRIVNERRREIGVRMALGATKGRIISDLMHSIVLRITAGVALGFGLSLISSHLLQSFLYGVKLVSFGVLGGVLGGTFTVLALAFMVPIKRAVSVQPGAAMREP